MRCSLGEFFAFFFFCISDDLFLEACAVRWGSSWSWSLRVRVQRCISERVSKVHVWGKTWCLHREADALSAQSKGGHLACVSVTFPFQHEEFNLKWCYLRVLRNCGFASGLHASSFAVGRGRLVTSQFGALTPFSRTASKQSEINYTSLCSWNTGKGFIFEANSSVYIYCIVGGWGS